MKRHRTGTTVVVPPFLRAVAAVADAYVGVVPSSQEEGMGPVEDNPTMSGLSRKLLHQRRREKRLRNQASYLRDKASYAVCNATKTEETVNLLHD